MVTTHNTAVNPVDPLERYKQSLNDMTQESHRVNVLNEAITAPVDHLEWEGQIQLEATILRAIVTSKYPKKDFAQIARQYGTSFDEIELIAKKLAKERGLDLEQVEFNGMIQQVKFIESITDAGFREWKLQAVAKQYRRTRRELMEAYNKALIHQTAIAPLNLTGLKQMSTQSTEWTVQGWFPAGVTILLHGHGGTAKTLMLYGVAAAIAKGEPWNDYPTKQGEVLLLQSDEPPHITQERLEMLGVTDDDPLLVFPGWQVEKMPQLEEYLRSRFEAGSPVRFLMVDSNTSVNRNTLISENDVEYARPVLQLADLAQRFGTTIVIVHHSNANGDARGTKAIHNSVSEVWALSVTDERTGDRLLRVQKNRLGRPPGRYQFEFDASTYLFAYKGEESDHNGETATNEKRIELWLSEDSQKNKPFTSEEISHYLNISRDSTRRALYELWSKGIILRTKKKPGEGKGFLYHAGTLPSDTRIDHSENADRFSDRFESIDKSVLSGESINRSAKTDKNENPESAETPILSDRLIDSPEKHTEKDLQIDHSNDHPSEIAIDSPIDQIADRFVEEGDIVYLNGTSVWHRHKKATKLPWQSVPKMFRNSLQIPIEVLDNDLFVELTGPSKVLTIREDKILVRNQDTGRTSVFRFKDANVLEKGRNAK